MRCGIFTGLVLSQGGSHFNLSKNGAKLSEIGTGKVVFSDRRDGQ